MLTRWARRAAITTLLGSLVAAGLVPLAAFGVLGLAVVVAIHEVAEVVVIANGVRAGRVGARLRAIAPVPGNARQAPEVALAGRG